MSLHIQYIVIRNGEVVNSAASMDKAIEFAKEETNEYEDDTAVYQLVADVERKVTVTVNPKVYATTPPNGYANSIYAPGTK